MRIERNIEMYGSRRAAAFIAGLLMSVSLTVMPVGSAWADEEAAGITITTDAGSNEETTEPEYDVVEDGFCYSLTADGKLCLENCTSEEKEIAVPASVNGVEVTELGKTAFGHADDSPVYEKIELPATISYISSDMPFMFCQELKEITVAADNKDYCAKDGVLFSKDMTRLICYPQSKQGNSYAVPEGVTALGEASMYATQLSEITFPSTLKETCYYSLGGNSKLTSLDLSGTALVTLGVYSMTGCEALEEVNLPDSLYEIEGGAFAGCSSLKEIELPEHIAYIGQMAFVNTMLSKIVIPDSVQEIAYAAFGYKYGEEGTVADSNFLIIGSYTGAAYTYATDVDVDNNYYNNFRFQTREQYEEEQKLLALDTVVSGEYTYALVDGEAVIQSCSSGDTVLNVPSEIDGYPVTMIYPTAFTPCTSVEIILPEGVKLVREMAFYKCEYLKKVTMPQSLETLGNNCFDGCESLEYADLGGAESIGTCVFLGCSSLREITISGNCKTFGDDSEDPFGYTDALEAINVTDGDGAYASSDGILYNNDKTRLIRYPMGRTDTTFVVPDSVKNIERCAFLSCTHLEDVVLPKKLEILGAYAFYGCSSLTSLRAYGDLKNIGEMAFGYSYGGTDGTEDARLPDFKLYAPKNSDAYKFAKNNNFEVVTGTVRIGSKNIRIGMLAGAAGLLLTVILGIIGVFAGKKVKAKKAEKKADEIRKKAAEKIKAKKEAEAEEEEKE